MNRMFALMLICIMLLSLTACQKPPEAPDATEPTTSAPAGEEIQCFDLNEIDLERIGELFSQKEIETRTSILLNGLSTPVMMELDGVNLLSISAYGVTVPVDGTCEYTSIYGNLQPVIYEQDGVIFLNIWCYDIGYSCVLFPDGTYMETYPGEEYSSMIYLDEDGQMCQSKFALKFASIEQWDTGPIDMAVSRDDFYYSIDHAQWSEEGYSHTAAESYTISDRYELDEIFDRAKAEGFYPDFDTLDELLAYNAERFQETP